MATKKQTSKLSLNVQHDYLTLKTPNGCFTVNRSGAKASGKLVMAFDKIDNHIQHLVKVKNKNYEEAMKTLLDENLMTKLFPQWNDELNSFTKGDMVKMTDVFAKKYPGVYEVTEMKRKTCYVKTPNGVIGFDSAFMVKA